jgi:hypothetical protein
MKAAEEALKGSKRSDFEKLPPLPAVVTAVDKAFE